MSRNNNYIYPDDSVYPKDPVVLEKDARGHFNNAGERSPYGITRIEHYSLTLLAALVASGNYEPEFAVKKAIRGAKALMDKLNNPEDV